MSGNISVWCHWEISRISISAKRGVNSVELDLTLAESKLLREELDRQIFEFEKMDSDLKEYFSDSEGDDDNDETLRFINIEKEIVL